MAKPFENGKFGNLANMAKMTNLMLKGSLWLWLFWQKWRIWRKFCRRFNLANIQIGLLKGSLGLSILSKMANPAKIPKMRKLARGHLQNINMTRLALLNRLNPRGNIYQMQLNQIHQKTPGENNRLMEVVSIMYLHHVLHRLSKHFLII